MNNQLTNDLNALLARYGWHAVMTELAQIALTYSHASLADALLQTAYTSSRVAEETPY